MKSVLVSILFLLVSISAHADYQGWIKIDRERSLYVEFTEPQRGKPIVVLANGLTQDTRYQKNFAETFAQQGYGVLRWDMWGQLGSLKRFGRVRDEIHFADQIRDLRALLVKMDLRAPMHFVGLSYGAMIVSMYTMAFPEHVLTCISMAPFTAPLANQHEWIKLQIKLVRTTNPMNRASDDELYLFFLRQIVYSSYPSAEPSVFDHPYKLEAALYLAYGARTYRFAEIAERIAPGKFHLIVAGSDEYIRSDVTQDAWDALPRRARVSRVIVEGARHKMNEDIPKFSAALIGEIFSKNPVFSGGRTVFANPRKGIVHDGRRTLIEDLPRD